jgi:hypothetical protein
MIFYTILEGYIKLVIKVELNKEFKSLTDCYRWLKSNGFEFAKKNNIYNVCNKEKTYLGFHFKYSDDLKANPLKVYEIEKENKEYE